MNKEKQKLVPEMRFSEFKNNWKDGTIADLADTIMGNAFKSGDFVSDGLQLVRMGNLYQGKLQLDRTPVFLPKSFSENHSRFLLNPFDILMSMTGTVGKEDYGYVIQIPEDSPELLLNQRVVKIVPKENCIKDFLLQLLKSENFLQVLYSLPGGTKQANLSIGQLKGIEILYPKNKKEQQKIANCLSSLDNLITTETEKLDNFKDHKKGLLQELFPVKGETKPQFRFPEFENDGDWEETILDDVADYANGKAHEKEISATGKHKVVNSKFISTEGRVVKFTNSANLKANIGDVLMVLSDIPNGKAIAKCFYVDKDDTYTVNQRICKITPTDIDNKFLFYIQNRNSYFLAFDDGVKQTNLRKDDVLSFPFLKPKDPIEQQKIASCLSSADDLIQEQISKIKALKAHKKGLMQQLFPNSI